MDYVERKAEEFLSYYVKGHDSDDELRQNVNSYLYLFNRNLDKRRFLDRLYTEVKQKYDEHLPKCTNPKTCHKNRNYEAALFFICQELEDLTGSDDTDRYVAAEGEGFSFNDRVELDRKLDEVLNRLEKLGFGQETIFNEIDALRNQTQLKKKDWMQLLKGKLIDISLSKVLENDTIEWVYKTLTNDSASC